MQMPGKEPPGQTFKFFPSDPF